MKGRRPSRHGHSHVAPERVSRERQKLQRPGSTGGQGDGLGVTTVTGVPHCKVRKTLLGVLGPRGPLTPRSPRVCSHLGAVAFAVPSAWGTSPRMFTAHRFLWSLLSVVFVLPTPLLALFFSLAFMSSSRTVDFT